MKGLFYGMGLGLGLMYILDPQAGADRRRRIRERAGDVFHRTEEATESAMENVGHRVQDAKQGARRVGDKIRNAGDSIRNAAQKRGLEELGGEMIDGDESRHVARRVLAGAAGGALTYYGFRKRGVLGTGLGTVGVGLLTYGATNRNVTRLIHSRKNGAEEFHVQKTIHVNAPVEEVFQFWSNYENFPRFMSHIKEVKDLGNGRSHWIASGPAGIPVEWKAIMTDRVPNDRLSWESEPESTLETSGSVRFERAGEGTDVHVEMSYRPPGGEIGQAIAKLFGADPQKAIEEDLEKIRPLLEKGGEGLRASAAAGSSQGSQAGAKQQSAQPSGQVGQFGQQQGQPQGQQQGQQQRAASRPGDSGNLNRPGQNPGTQR